MAKIFGKDTYLSEKRLSYTADGLFLVYVLFIAVITFWVYVFVFHFPSKGAQVAGIILLIVFFILRKPIEKKLKLMLSYRNGQLGEESVRVVLQALPDTYVVFENVVIPPMKSNIDFVVVGPTGIYSIEVKSHKGSVSYDESQLLLNGKRFEKDILHQTTGEAIQLADYLRLENITFPEIKPVLVFSNKYMKIHFGKTPIQGILVIGASWLVDSIQNDMNKVMLTSDQIENIQNALIQSQ